MTAGIPAGPDPIEAPDMTETTTTPVIPQQDELMNTILGQLYDTLTGGDGDVPGGRHAFFAWATPGIPISNDQFDFMGGFVGATEAESSRRFALAADFAALVDFKPDPGGAFTEADQQTVIASRRGTLSGEWDRILRMSQVVDEPLTEEQQAKLDRYLDLLTTTRTETDLESGEAREITDDSALVKQYNAKMIAYENAALEFNVARIEAMTGTTPGASARFAINGPILSRRVRAALDDWESAGKKNEVERIRGHIAQVTGRSMVAFKRRLVERFERTKLTDSNSGVEFHYSALSPANILQATGWTTFTFDSTKATARSSTRTNKWGAGATVLGGFRFGGRGGGERSEVASSLDTRTFTLSFSMAQAAIRYPFIDAAWLESAGWRFPPGESALTDGATPPQGALIAYPETMILVRDLVLDFRTSSESSKEISAKVNAKGGVNWGIFNLGGSYDRASNDKVVESEGDGQKITVAGTQIIGYRCYVVPGPCPTGNSEVPEDRWV